MDLTGIGVFLMWATICERLTEYLFGDHDRLRPYMHYLAAGVGVIVAVLFRLDLVQSVFGATSPLPYAASIVTGLLIGGGSNWLHDTMNKVVTMPADPTTTIVPVIDKMIAAVTAQSHRPLPVPPVPAQPPGL